MTTEQLKRKLGRIILDLEDLIDSGYVDSESEANLIQELNSLKNINIYSTKV